MGAIQRGLQQYPCGPFDHFFSTSVTDVFTVTNHDLLESSKGAPVATWRCPNCSKFSAACLFCACEDFTSLRAADIRKGAATRSGELCDECESDLVRGGEAGRSSYVLLTPARLPHA